ncbi:hypothetical protein [Streptomyces albipurpureus]|uniref:Uncharacterized protein n=1 Tax=Streptomyces albipurpureus TaxID=2897419 RepID=A0ABT0UNC9_9ACTN|nr:hypothetical protein [Streptomyces sp. CWNU-1]MCM2388766.1 hypothetical protein [Streptomyces sp. CWNU-1]
MMSNASSEWYTSGTLWTTVATSLVALLVGAAGAWAAIRSAHPVRRLTYQLKKNVALVDDDQYSSHLTVSHDGAVLQAPRIAEIVVTNVGRKDITAQQFHGDAPIVFDLGASVAALLSSTSSPDSTSAPAADTAGTSIRVPPSLLKRRQSISYTVLVDGRESELRCTAALTDTTVSHAEESKSQRGLMPILAGLTASLIAFIISQVDPGWVGEAVGGEAELPWKQVQQCSRIDEVKSFDQCRDLQKVLRPAGPPGPTP